MKLVDRTVLLLRNGGADDVVIFENVVIMAGKGRSLPLVIALARLAPGINIVGCDDTSLVRERQNIGEIVSILQEHATSIRFVNDQLSRTSHLAPLLGGGFGQKIVIVASMDSLTSRAQDHALRLTVRSPDTTSLVFNPSFKNKILSVEEALQALNDDVLAKGVWKNVEGTGGENSNVLCFVKSKALKFQCPTAGSRISARVGGGPPITVPASTMERQGAGLPDRARKICLPTLIVERNYDVSKLSGSIQLGVIAGENLKKNQRVTECGGKIFFSREEAFALLEALKVSFDSELFLFLSEKRIKIVCLQDTHLKSSGPSALFYADGRQTDDMPKEEYVRNHQVGRCWSTIPSHCSLWI
jgi:hypothetical protein